MANSVFQGNIIISEDTFIRKFPSISGYRLFLIDAPYADLGDVREDLSWVMQDQGMDLLPAAERLSEFNTVQNTYLAIFLILGGFGLLLGSAGLGIVVSRNIGERRSELALLRAVGFSGKSVLSVVLAEHLALLASGILLGTLASLLATLPSITTPGSAVPYLTITAILVIVSLNGAFWTYAAARKELRGDLIPALRKE